MFLTGQASLDQDLDLGGLGSGRARVDIPPRPGVTRTRPCLSFLRTLSCGFYNPEIVPAVLWVQGLEPQLDPIYSTPHTGEETVAHWSVLWGWLWLEAAAVLAVRSSGGQAWAWEPSGVGDSIQRRGQQEEEAHALGELCPLCLGIRLLLLLPPQSLRAKDPDSCLHKWAGSEHQAGLGTHRSP